MCPFHFLPPLVLKGGSQYAMFCLFCLFCLYCCYIIYCMLPLDVNKVVQYDLVISPLAHVQLRDF